MSIFDFVKPAIRPDGHLCKGYAVRRAEIARESLRAVLGIDLTTIGRRPLSPAQLARRDRRITAWTFARSSSFRIRLSASVAPKVLPKDARCRAISPACFGQRTPKGIRIVALEALPAARGMGQRK